MFGSHYPTFVHLLPQSPSVQPLSFPSQAQSCPDSFLAQADLLPLPSTSIPPHRLWLPLACLLGCIWHSDTGSVTPGQPF